MPKNERKLLFGVYHAIENPGVHCFDVKVYTAAKSGFRFVFSAKNNAESSFQIENVNGFCITHFCRVHAHTCMHASMYDVHACENAESASHPSVLGRTAGPRTAA